MTLPPKFMPINLALAHLNEHARRLNMQAQNQNISASLKRTVELSIKSLNLRIEDIEDQIGSAVLMDKDPSKSELDVLLFYNKALEIAVELLVYHDGYTGYYKEKMDEKRKEGRNHKNSPNQMIMEKAANDMKQNLGRDLIGTDYPDWAQKIKDSHPTPPVMQKVRANKKDGVPLKPSGQVREDIARENPWPEATLRKKFKEITGHKATKKK
jgi:hypothetical protein